MFFFFFNDPATTEIYTLSLHAALPIFTGRARLAAEAGRVGGIAERQRIGVQDLLHVERREGDLRRPRQVEAVLGDLVDVRLLGREEAGYVHRVLADEHRRPDEGEPLAGERRDREPEDRLLEQRRVADDVAEPRAGDAGGALHLEAPQLEVVADPRQLRGRAPAADLDRVLLRVAVGNRLVRRIRHLRQRGVARALRVGELLLRPSKLFLDRLQLLDLLRRRLALELLPRPQLVDARDEPPPSLVRGQPRVERLRGSFARNGGAEPVGVVARGAGVDQLRRPCQARGQ